MADLKIKQNIPQDWVAKPLSDFCINLDNKRVPITKSARISGNIPYYGATGIIDHVNDYIFNDELLLIGEDGADWSSFAKTSFVVSGKTWVNNHAHVLKCKNEYLNKYLEQYINWQNLEKYTTGGTRKKLNKDALMNIIVFLPEKESEQKKIIKILSIVDNDIAKTQKMIETTEKLKRGLMQQLFTQGIGHKKFKKTKIGKIPEEWKVLPLSGVADVVDSLHRTPVFSETGFSMVRVTDIKDGFLNLEHSLKVSDEIYKEFTSSYEPKKNNIVLSRVGSYGVSSYVNSDEKFCMGQNTVVIDCHTNPKFIFYALNSNLIKEQFENEVAGSGYKSLSLKSIRNLRMPLPKEEEQQKISKIVAAIDEKISVNRKSKEKLMQLKKVLMQELLSGKKRTINI